MATPVLARPLPPSLVLLASLLPGCGGSGGGGGSAVVRFLHVNTPEAAIGAAQTRLSHPALDGDATRRIWVTAVLDPDGAPTPANPHPLTVFFVSGRWGIVNADAGSMPVGTAFFVTVDGGFDHFLHEASAPDTSGNSTEIGHPAAGGAGATLFVTQHLNASGGTTVNPAEIGVWRSGTWRIFNQDLSPMPVGADFLVAVPTTRTFVHHADAANTTGNATAVSHPDLPADPAVHLQVTANWNPDDPGVYDDHPVAVRFDPVAVRWTIVNTDGAPIPNGASFNVWSLP